MRVSRTANRAALASIAVAALLCTCIEVAAQSEYEQLLPVWDSTSVDKNNAEISLNSGTALYFNSREDVVKLCYANFKFSYDSLDFEGSCGSLMPQDVPFAGRAIFQSKSAAQPMEGVPIPGVVWMLKPIDPAVSSIHACVMFKNRFSCRQLSDN